MFDFYGVSMKEKNTKKINFFFMFSFIIKKYEQN